MIAVIGAGIVGANVAYALAARGEQVVLIERLSAETTKLLGSAEMAKQYLDRDVEPGGGTPQEFEQFIRAEIEKWQGVAIKAGIKPQ